MTMTEAPLSYTIRVIDPTGFDEMFTIRGDDPADYFGKIAKLKKWLVANGYTPTGSQRSPAQPANGPICPTHGPMKPSTKKAGSYYCPAKLFDGTYCKSKADGPMPQHQAIQPAQQNGSAPVAPALFNVAPPQPLDDYYSRI